MVFGREQPEWKDNWAADAKQRTEEDMSQSLGKGLLRCLCQQEKSTSDDVGRVLIICARGECGGYMRLLQRQSEDELSCQVIIGSNHVETWRGEVESATRGVVLLQTQSVLRDPVRLLQLFEAEQQRHPFICVNIEDGGFDFAQLKPLLLSLSSELSPGAMSTLRAELMTQGNGVGQLASSISDAVSNTISTCFNPAGGDAMIEAAIQDILHKLTRATELLGTEAIAVSVLQDVSVRFSSSSRSTSEVNQRPPQYWRVRAHLAAHELSTSVRHSFQSTSVRFTGTL